MISKTFGRKIMSLCLTVAVLSVYSMVVLAVPGQNAQTGELTANGQVTVNGQTAITGATVFSDSTITTAADSSALISLGKIGKVELLPNTVLRLSFNENGFSGELSAGKIAVTSMAGKTATITTKDGTTVADTNQANIFFVDVQCGNTRVETQSGLAVLRAAGKDQQVAAGKSASAGQTTPQVKCAPPPPSGSNWPAFGGGALAAILLAAGGAIATAVIIGVKNGDSFDQGGGTTVVSPNR